MSASKAAATAVRIYARPGADGRGLTHLMDSHAVMLGWPEMVGRRRLLTGRPLCGSDSADGLWLFAGMVEAQPRRVAAICSQCLDAAESGRKGQR